MKKPLETLGVLVALLAVVYAAVGVYVAFVAKLTREQMAAISGAEVVAAALLVLPWFMVYARKASVRFAPGETAGAAWNSLAMASVVMIVGQLLAYLPLVLDLGPVEPLSLIAGQLLPAAFRVVLCWALFRMRRAYRETGLDFHLKPLDVAVCVAVCVVAVSLIAMRETLFAYWAANSIVDPAMRDLMLYAQIFNFLLYPLVFVLSLTMFRYAVQMGGGLVARAWGGVALYGLLQPVHAFVIASGYRAYGPMLAIALDNFIVLVAFGALACGAISQVAASDLRSRER